MSILLGIHLGGDELVALAVDVDDLDGGVIFEFLAQLGDVNVHRAGIEVVVIDPDGLQGEVALQDLVHVGAQQAQQLALLGGEVVTLVVGEQHLALGVEGEFADLVNGDFFALLALDAAQDGLDAHHELLHREGLGDVVVGTNLEALENVLLQGLGGEEDDGHIAVDGADFLCQLVAVLLGHHHVEQADVIFALEESLVTGLSIGKQLGFEALVLEVLTGEGSQILVVLA